MTDKHPVDIASITLTEGDPDTSFNLSGYVNRYRDYKFHAKVYDSGSAFGIDGGRISKLDVRRNGELVIQYDRGWSIEPRGRRERKVLKAIVASFPERQREQENGGAAMSRQLSSDKTATRLRRACKPDLDRER